MKKEEIGMRKKCKRSQEEMVGFVLIVVLVTVIALVFLAISIRKAPPNLESSEIRSFLQSAMKYTTDCYESKETRLDMDELIEACYKGDKCEEEESCEVLSETFSDMLNASFKPGIENRFKAYNLDVYAESTNETVLSLKTGKCIGMITKSDVRVYTDMEDMVVKLEVCG